MPMGQMPSKEEIVKMRLDQLTQQLSLTAEQQASAKAISKVSAYTAELYEMTVENNPVNSEE